MNRIRKNIAKFIKEYDSHFYIFLFISLLFFLTSILFVFRGYYSGFYSLVQGDAAFFQSLVYNVAENFNFHVTGFYDRALGQAVIYKDNVQSNVFLEHFFLSSTIFYAIIFKLFPSYFSMHFVNLFLGFIFSPWIILKIAKLYQINAAKKYTIFLTYFSMPLISGAYYWIFHSSISAGYLWVKIILLV